MTRPAPRPAPRREGLPTRALDAAGVLVTLSVGLALWRADRGPASTLLPADAPPWARIRDYLLDGPDAGAWASNALSVWLGRVDELDPHRLPILPYLTALALRLHPDPALAGHLVNHVLHVLLGPVVYLLGRRWMGRGMALGAALVAVTFPPAIASAERYGVDPLVTLALPLAMLAAEGAARRATLAPVFGVVAGLCACAHLTTIGIPFCALLLVFLRGAPGARRWLGAGGFAAGVLLGVGAAFANYPTLPWGILLGSLAEGVSPAGPNGDPAALGSSIQRALATVADGGPAAVERTIAFLAAATRPAWIPWSAALFLPWLGVLGLGLGEERGVPPPGGRGASQARADRRWVAPLRGLGVGLPLAAALVPLLAFAAAGSPARYTINFFPLGALLMFRGAASVVALAEIGLARVAPRWPQGAGGLALGMAIAWSLWDPARALTPVRMPPMRRDIADWRLGALIRAHFPPGGGAACLRREVVAYAGRAFCPYTPGFDFGGEAEPYRAHLGAECAGDGPIPYVVLVGIADGATPARARMDAWVEAGGGTLLETFTDAAYGARLYAVTRPEK